MYADQTSLHTFAQILIAGYFIWMGIKNIRLWKMNLQRIAVQNLPAVPCLILGFAMQFTGAFMVLLDWHTNYGAILLIAFVLLASTLHHRFWEIKEPKIRSYHFLLVTNNVAIVAGLLFLV